MKTTEQKIADYFGFTTPELRRTLARMFYPTIAASALFIGFVLYNIFLLLFR